MEKIRSETAIETEENANNLLVSLDSQESQIRSRLKNPEDENWLRKNFKKVTMAMTLIAGPSILMATEGCGRNNPTGGGVREQQSAGPGNNLPSQNIEQQPSRTMIREINGENGIKIHIYSDNTYDVEQPDQDEGHDTPKLESATGHENDAKQEKKETETSIHDQNWAKTLSGYVKSEVTPLGDGRYVIKDGSKIKELDERDVAELNEIVDKYNGLLQMDPIDQGNVDVLAKKMVKEFRGVIAKCPEVLLDHTTGEYEVVEKKPSRKLTVEEEVARKKAIHEKAEQARASLGLNNKNQKNPEDISEDEKAFRRDPRPNTLRQQDWNDRHRGPTN